MLKYKTMAKYQTRRELVDAIRAEYPSGFKLEDHHPFRVNGRRELTYKSLDVPNDEIWLGQRDGLYFVQYRLSKLEAGWLTKRDVDWEVAIELLSASINAPVIWYEVVKHEHITKTIEQ